MDLFGGADRALHRRTALACTAAAEAGVAGRFGVWERDGLLAVLATDPSLAFLSTVYGVSADNVAAAIDLVGDSVWQGVQPVLVESPVDSFLSYPQIALAPPIGGLTTVDWKRAVAPREGRGSACGSDSSTMDSRLADAGFVGVGERGLAVCRLEGSGAGDPDVVEADGELFARVLLAGYQVGGNVAAFIAAEHRSGLVRRFLLLIDGEPVAAAAMTVHDGVAVLGGASTLPAYRGRGAQSRLIRHRLAVAGCSMAVATAVPGSGSAANLRRAGFEFFVRQGWGRANTATDCSARLPR